MSALSNFPVLRNKHGDGKSDKPHDGGGKYSEFWNFVKGWKLGTRDLSRNEIFSAAVQKALD